MAKASSEREFYHSYVSVRQLHEHGQGTCVRRGNKRLEDRAKALVNLALPTSSSAARPWAARAHPRSGPYAIVVAVRAIKSSRCGSQPVAVPPLLPAQRRRVDGPSGRRSGAYVRLGAALLGLCTARAAGHGPVGDGQPDDVSEVAASN